MAETEQHLDKPYCDILGRNYCSKCNEGLLREASFVSSIADAENIINLQRETANNLPYDSLTSRTPSKLLECRAKGGWISRQAYSPVDDRKIDKLVHSMFPIIYKALSAKSCGRPKGCKTSNESEMAVFATTNRKLSARSFTSESLFDSVDSETCTSDINCFDESKAEGREKLSHLSDFARRKRPSSKYAIKGNSEKENDSWEYVRNEETVVREPSDQIIDEVPRKVNDTGETPASNSSTSVEYPEKTRYQNRHRRIKGLSVTVNNQDETNQKNLPGRTFHMQVRRSSVAGVTIRTLSFEKLRVQVENWKPSFVEGYPRPSGRISLKDYRKEPFNSPREHGDLPKQKTNINSRSFKKASPTISNNSLLPVEPVMCKIKYIKNRWKDEAIFNGNLFAMKLDA